jgi:hypothetical protein
MLTYKLARPALAGRYQHEEKQQGFSFNFDG